ncbi:MAG: DUF2835 domain-containing protein [Kangiellaceae bacterium]|nr:DUF2835 domain-containing protein [Kangiellaceae bacterium]MCW9000330.1 DUF2835 domain-containing protein [Kangiellaceae bacterium]
MNDLEIRNQVFRLNISPEEFVEYYSGRIKWVITESEQGLKVKFPANLLNKHVSHLGVRGRFNLSYTCEGKVVSLDKIGDL